jgi:hypothetical protein
MIAAPSPVTAAVRISALPSAMVIPCICVDVEGRRRCCDWRGGSGGAGGDYVEGDDDGDTQRN